jgi:hypothetical protein
MKDGTPENVHVVERESKWHLLGGGSKTRGFLGLIIFDGRLDSVLSQPVQS